MSDACEHTFVQASGPKQDEALGIEMAAPSIALCDQGELQRIEGAGHWVLHEEGVDVSRRILAFLGRTTAAVADPAARRAVALRV